MAKRDKRIGLIVELISLLGIAFTVWAWYDARSTRQLLFAVSPGRSTVVRPDQPDGLQVSFNGEPVSGERVFVARVAIWNGGRESIKPEHIRTPIQIRWGDGARVLTARTTSSSPPAVAPILDTSTVTEHTLGVSWAMLEHEDGFCVELLMAGDAGVPIQLQGMVEGKLPIRGRDDGRHRKPTEPDPLTLPRYIGIMSVMLLAAGAYFLTRTWLEAALAQARFRRRAVQALAIGVGVVLFVAALWLYAWIDYRYIMPWPPFEF